MIGINTDVTMHPDGTLLHALRAPYAEAIWIAGGRPVLIPSTSKQGAEIALEGLDGLLMTGGDDIDPRRFGGHDRGPEEVPLHPLREAFDLALLRRAVDRGLPLLCVCLGVQEMAVAFGGCLHQSISRSIPQALIHRGADRTSARHEVRLEEGTLLRRILGPSLEVNSIHRQAVQRPGDGQRIAARAPDGVIEALETGGPGFALGVQWHPELILEEPGQLAIFRALVVAASGLDPAR